MHYPQLPHPSPAKFTLDISLISDYTFVSLISDLLHLIWNSFIYIIV